MAIGRSWCSGWTGVEVARRRTVKSLKTWRARAPEDTNEHRHTLLDTTYPSKKFRYVCFASCVQMAEWQSGRQARACLPLSVKERYCSQSLALSSIPLCLVKGWLAQAGKPGSIQGSLTLFLLCVFVLHIICLGRNYLSYCKKLNYLMDIFQLLMGFLSRPLRQKIDRSGQIS